MSPADDWSSIAGWITARWRWAVGRLLRESTIIVLRTVDGSEIPFPTTWDGAKTM